MTRMPKPVDFDGPYDEDSTGYFYTVGVVFESEAEANEWLRRQREALGMADPGEKKSLWEKLFGSE